MAMSSLITRLTDVHHESVTKRVPPIYGYQTEPLMSLEEAIKPVAQFFNGIEENTLMAKENCAEPKEGLTSDESAAIYLYTMQFDGRPSLFELLNQNLRAENRRQLKPWFAFLKLFLTALDKLPSSKQTVWRGVSGVDLRFEYPKGKEVIWWGVSSCASNVQVLENDHFLDKTSLRTFFMIECRSGKSIALHSSLKNTVEEIIIMPGSCFQVISQFDVPKNICIIHLREIDGPYSLLEVPFAQTKISQLSCASASPKNLKPAAKELVVCARPFDEFVMDPPSSDVTSGASGKSGGNGDP